MPHLGPSVSSTPDANNHFFRNTLPISGNRLNSATHRNHNLLSIAGYPLTIAPAGTSLGIPLCAVAIAPSPILQCPATPTCPASITFFPTSVDPASPACAHNKLSSPTFDPCPTCTKLSIFAPREMRVSPTLARSMHALAWISTSSSITVGPDCTILCQCPLPSLANPNPSPPTTTPFCKTTLLPMRQNSRTLA